MMSIMEDHTQPARRTVPRRCGARSTEDQAMRRALVAAAAVLAIMNATPTRAETPEEWITLGARVHGGFGAFIPLGIRIGLDALDRLNAKPREIVVTYYDGAQ